MSCCDRVYYCPTVQEEECPVHGGFNICCGKPDDHRCLRCRNYLRICGHDLPFTERMRSVQVDRESLK